LRLSIFASFLSLVRIAHLADLHLGFRQFHRQSQGGINQREADVGRAFRAAVDGVLASRPDAVIIAGDLFHAVRPTNTSIVFAFQQLQRLREGLPGAPIVMIAGNHDTPRSSETGSILRLYEELGVHAAVDEPRRLDFPECELSVLAVPHAALFAPERPLLRPEGSARHQVLVLHGEVEGLFPFDRSSVEYGGALLDPEVLKREPWSYVALGHYHVQHEVSPRIWYCGALEYVSSNPWGELADEARHGTRGKAWLLADLERGTVARQPVPSARTVYGAPSIDAADRTPAELDRLIGDRLAQVPGGLADAIVRLVVERIPRHIVRELDHAALRAAKATALHLQLDFRRPEPVRAVGVGSPGRRQTLPELVGEFLGRRPLPERVPRDRFVGLGLELLQEPDEDVPGEGG
jgi:DNA repair exonuclease SbcCD nuclease subunit